MSEVSLRAFDDASVGIELRQAAPPQGGKPCSLLDVNWMQPIDFLPFSLLPLKTDADEEEFSTVLQFQLRDLRTLLALPYHVFWSHVIFDNTLHLFLSSFVKAFPRPFDLSAPLFPQGIQTLLDSVAQKTFLVFLRISTHKESEQNYITAETYGKILYENWILDIPKLFDLCAIYGSSNRALLSRMVENVFAKQPAYRQDLVNSFLELNTLIDHTCREHGLEGVPSNVKVQRAASKDAPVRPLKTLTLEEMILASMFVNDVACTTARFAEVFADCAVEAHRSGILGALAALYEQLSLGLLKRLGLSLETKGSNPREVDLAEVFVQATTLGQTPSASFAEVVAVGAARNLREAILSTLRSLFVLPACQRAAGYTSSTEPHDVQYRQQRQKQHAEAHGDDRVGRVGDRPVAFTTFGQLEDALFSSLDLLVENPGLVADLAASRECCEWFDTLLVDKKFDKTRLQYYKTLLSRPPEQNAEVQRGHTADIGQQAPVEESGVPVAPLPASQGDTVNSIAEKVLEENIQSVLAIVPDLGRGFIEACLDACGHNVETMLNQLFSDTLPDEVKSLPRNMPSTRNGAGVKRSGTVDRTQTQGTASTSASTSTAGIVPSSTSASSSRSYTHTLAEPQLVGMKPLRSKSDRERESTKSLLAGGREMKDAVLAANTALDREEAELYEAYTSGLGLPEVDEDEYFGEARLLSLDSRFNSYAYEDEYDDTYDGLKDVGTLEQEDEEHALSTHTHSTMGRKWAPANAHHWKGNVGANDDEDSDDDVDDADDDDDDDDGDKSGSKAMPQHGRGSTQTRFTTPSVPRDVVGSSRGQHHEKEKEGGSGKKYPTRQGGRSGGGKRAAQEKKQIRQQEKQEKRSEKGTQGSGPPASHNTGSGKAEKSQAQARKQSGRKGNEKKKGDVAGDVRKSAADDHRAKGSRSEGSQKTKSNGSKGSDGARQQSASESSSSNNGSSNGSSHTRRRKEANKAKHANHNRKAAAQKKMSKGMF